MHFSYQKRAIWEKYIESIKLHKRTFLIKVPFIQQKDLSFKMTSFLQKYIKPPPSYYVGIEAKFSPSLIWYCRLIPEPLSHDNNRKNRLISLLLFFSSFNWEKELEKMRKFLFPESYNCLFPADMIGTVSRDSGESQNMTQAHSCRWFCSLEQHSSSSDG